MHFQQINKPIIFICVLLCITSISCKKLVEISAPTDTITTGEIFSTEPQAEAAMAGVYNHMIHGADPQFTESPGVTTFSAGLAGIAGGLSSGELYNYQGSQQQGFYALSTNKLSIYNNAPATSIWNSAYTIIYNANSVIEGIAASNSPLLRDSVRKELTGEAKLVRAFCYFYLTNFFGDVPLALTVDFNKTASIPKTPQPTVYRQIIQDLKDAEAVLAKDYSVAKGKRVRPNKWAAAAMLAKTYLFTGDYQNAALKATEVIGQADLYQLEQDLNAVFLTGSREAIWQLKQTEQSPVLKNATPEGMTMLPAVAYTSTASFCLSDVLINAFEQGDLRYVHWVDSTLNILNGVSAGKTYYPAKYKTGGNNAMAGAPAMEYHMVMRLAEMYLVRAEAKINGAPGGKDGAIDDLNAIRNRAGLGMLAGSLSEQAVKAAVAKERQIELFAEGGNRWFDLKRTGAAHAVLTRIPLKLPWEGDYQLLYPIPVREIQTNSSLIQNDRY